MTDAKASTDKHLSAGSDKWRATPLNFRKSKIDYSVSVGFEHPDHALNEEYLRAGAADDHERPLCVGIHNSQICRRPARKGARFCAKGKGSA